MSKPGVPLDSFSTFGDLLKHLRRRARLTQRELSIAVKYSEAQISRLEQNQRPPDLASVLALFVPALFVEDEPETVARLMELASQARSETRLPSHTFLVSHSAQRQIVESVQIEEEELPNNLPLQLTSFIGRQMEIAELTRLLAGENPSRLVTLTGPGGIGKTRLALQATIRYSNRYRDGIWFVDLAPLSSSEMIPQTVASALNVPSAGNQSVEETLLAYLRAKQMLVLLDNCEHLVHAVAQLVDRILRSCARVQVLATSRESLHVPGEVNLQVPPLSVPLEPDAASQTVLANESVQLFVERAHSTFPSLNITGSSAAVIGRICKVLDGIPLAIELAAARAGVLSLSQIESRLKDRFDLLTTGQRTFPRHQTLRATLDWSHGMLSEAEKILFRHLSVFAGGWTLEAANSVCAEEEKDLLDSLAELVNKSLVVVKIQPDGEVRYSMLETIREFARGQLRAAGKLESMSARHFDYFFTKAQQGEPKLFATQSSVDWAEGEIDNMRAALSWALEIDNRRAPSQERAGRALDLMLHIWPLWLSRGYSIEGNEWLDKLLAVHTAPTHARARALLLAGDFAGLRGDALGKMRLTQEALALAKRLGDKKRIAWALMEMGLVERDRKSPEATEFLSESLGMFQELNDALWVCRTSFMLAETLMESGEIQAARQYWKRGLDLCQAVNDKWQMGWGLHGLGNLERLEGHLEKALQLYRESLELKVSVRDILGIMYSLASFAQVAASQGKYRRAAVIWGAAEKIGETLNMFLVNSREPLHTSLIPETRAALGETAFHTAWTEGRGLKMQQAVDYALDLSTD